MADKRIEFIESKNSGLKVLLEVVEEKALSLKGKVDVVVGLDSRGFLIGPSMAKALGVPFVPIRKKGKLPPKVISLSYDLEYGSATIEIQESSIKKGARVLLVDDLLATGGTLESSMKLIDKIGAVTSEIFVLIELKGLGGAKRLNHPVESLISYD
ncbi:APRT [Lepeophtheirus salmonis]|uniref:adenine phosphoribosyltransferase n=1 Tax=Lepeophtheirus salmonis TaxID=72036 RepID=A0A7R8D5Q0_LEPSM|nr:APRT [Lepeophtheirus salmonis]CAF2981874.1 APRT [Lepeophtheirus salmonis]